MPLTTRCPHCGRLFPVYAQQIKARRSKVECPQCGRRFGAVSGLLEEQIPPSETAYGRRKRTGKTPFVSASSAFVALDAGTARFVDLQALARICHLLKCQVQDILAWEWETGSDNLEHDLESF